MFSSKFRLLKFCYIIILLSFIGGSSAFAQRSKLVSSKASIYFLCTSSFLDIEGYNLNAKLFIDAEKRIVIADVPMRYFTFDKSSNYQTLDEAFLDSKQFPKARFIGTYRGNINLNEDGIYEGNLYGKLIMKGVARNRILPFRVVVQGDLINAESDFDASIVEYKIQAPLVFRHKISETVSIKLKALFEK